MSPAKHSSASVTDGHTDRQTDGQTMDKVILCRYASQATRKPQDENKLKLCLFIIDNTSTHVHVDGTGLEPRELSGVLGMSTSDDPTSWVGVGCGGGGRLGGCITTNKTHLDDSPCSWAGLDPRELSCVLGMSSSSSSSSDDPASGGCGDRIISAAVSVLGVGFTQMYFESSPMVQTSSSS